jgi:hypothetical protein
MQRIIGVWGIIDDDVEVIMLGVILVPSHIVACSPSSINLFEYLPEDKNHGDQRTNRQPKSTSYLRGTTIMHSTWWQRVQLLKPPNCVVNLLLLKFNQLSDKSSQTTD